MSRKLDAEIARIVITPEQRGILAFLDVIGIDKALLAEVEQEFIVNPKRGLALAKDLGWTPAMRKSTSHRGYADANGNYSPALYDAAQRQAKARHEAKRATAAARKRR